MSRFFARTAQNCFDPFLYEFALDLFSIVQCWEPFPLNGPVTGRAFEEAFYWYCTRKDVQLTEKAGCCTLLGQASASGFHHESDAVIALPLLTIHIELK